MNLSANAVEKVNTRYGSFWIDKERDRKMAGAFAKGLFPTEPLIEMARLFLKPGGIVLDIGAHIGTFSLPLTSLAGKVIAFEPSPQIFALLVQNAAERSPAPTLINKALSSTAGEGALVVRNTANAGATTLVAGGSIPISVLDDEVSQADLIKIDVEGMELKVLQGGERLISRSRPVVFFEVNISQLRAHGTSLRSLAKFFIQRGYVLYIPLAGSKGRVARVRSITVLAACIAPRALLFFGESAPFDLIAVPQEHSLPCPSLGFTAALVGAVRHNVRVKARRARNLIGY